jgi:hypothetical protein
MRAVVFFIDIDVARSAVKGKSKRGRLGVPKEEAALGS